MLRRNTQGASKRLGGAGRECRGCEGVIETIDHVIVECDDYEKYIDEGIFMVEDIMGRNEGQIRVMNGHRFSTIPCLM